MIQRRVILVNGVTSATSDALPQAAGEKGQRCSAAIQCLPREADRKTTRQTPAACVAARQTDLLLFAVHGGGAPQKEPESSNRLPHLPARWGRRTIFPPPGRGL